MRSSRVRDGSHPARPAGQGRSRSRILALTSALCGEGAERISKSSGPPEHGDGCAKRHRFVYAGGPLLRPRSGILLPMHALRLAAAATVATAALVTVSLGACDNITEVYNCAAPLVNETGANGGPDPCHCDPPPSSSYEACGCLSDPTDQTSISEYDECILVFREEVEAGVGGGS